MGIQAVVAGPGYGTWSGQRERSVERNDQGEKERAFGELTKIQCGWSIECKAEGIAGNEAGEVSEGRSQRICVPRVGVWLFF